MLLFLIFAFCSFLSVLKCFIQIAYSSDVCALAKQKVVVLHHHCGLSAWYQRVPGGGARTCLLIFHHDKANFGGTRHNGVIQLRYR